MKEDLNKAEQKWAQRRLFAPKRRSRMRWLWLVLVLGALLYWLASGQVIDSPMVDGVTLPLF